MIKLLKQFNWLLSLLFGVAVFLFFAFYYQYHLHYQEQLQLFLFTPYYWSDLMSRPGGLADYLGTFFTQFYYYSWSGALIISILLVLLQLGIKKLCNVWADRSLIILPFTFVPSIIIWGILCDENYLLSALIAVLLPLGAALLHLKIKSPVFRIIYIFLALPLLYWLSGGVFWIFGLLCILSEWLYFKQLTKFQWGILFVIVIGCILLPPYVASIFIQYPLRRLWWGISYHRYPVVSPYPLLALWSSIIIIPLLFAFIKGKISRVKNVTFLSTSGIIMVSLFAFFMVKNLADWQKEEIMAYDYYIRTQDWQKIIRMANHKDPNTPLSVTCLNLALSKDGSMGNSMFRYYQNGPEGLLPTFQRDFTSPLMSGEVYYHLGFLNTSMRYAFEAMEALPDYKKSSRAMLRIAEINLLNGEYKVAEKYLKILQHTLFYSKQAEQMLECLGNEQKINANPQWSLLKKYRMKDDFLFSENEKDQMLGLLFVNNQSNKMAFEYLIAYTLLTKDLDHFVQYFPLGKNLGYKEIPAHYQEALLFYWINTGHDVSSLPWSIDPAVVQNYINFAKALASGANVNALSGGFSQTYWYYLQFAGGDPLNYSQNPIY
ncbi:DUF6057 family protein [Dysgonomonas macrotermitis]|uniref:Transmembrane protein n=1 Tax=Dysgonomonas macrotermitis TaxID=1346286 RepID=A0A1M4T3T1_9BACT|nr:DUF6057 family protein [Dysgonomonas macrotermitis]SHE39123.1 hypothetical protein SAMN05444362_101230 [Dysgonomonas macrotermitis]